MSNGLYYKPGGSPAILPPGDYGTNIDGEQWFFSPLEDQPEAIAACGYILAPELPSYDVQTEKPVWNVDQWSIIPMTEDELQAKARENVPAGVTPRQLRLALYYAGKLEQIEAFIASGDAPAPAKISWEYATEFLRSDPMLAQFGAMLHMTDADIDAVFVAAAKIQ